MKRWLLRAMCGPWDVVTSLLLVVLMPFARGSLRWEHGVLWLDVAHGSLIFRAWGYSTTFGHAVLLQPDLRATSVETHELVHVRQFEGAVCSLYLATLTGAICHALLGITGAAVSMLMLGPWWSYFGASTSAFLRSERAYLDNEYERAARALSDSKGQKLLSDSPETSP